MDNNKVHRNPMRIEIEGSTNGHKSYENDVDFNSPTPPPEGNGDNSDSESNSNLSEVTSTSSTTIDHHCHPNKFYLEGAIYHLFLPKRVPSTAQVDQVFIDEWILHHVSDILQEINFDPITPIRKMFELWKFLQPKSSTCDQARFAQRFSHRIGEMKIGDSIGIYVRNQNCTLLISKLDEDYTLVETFRPSLPSESIMSVVGPVTVKYPETSNVIHHKDLLSSQVFAKHLHELCVNYFDASMKSSMKANQEFLEYREVPDPFLISDWLVALLVPGCHHSYTSSQVTKKVRDDVNCKRSASAVPFRRSGIWMSIKVALYLRLVQTIGNENDAKIIYKTIILWILADVVKQYSETSSAFDTDLTTQMLTNLGRRVKKVQRLTCAENSLYAQEIVKLWNSTVNFVYSVVTTVHEQIQMMWNLTCSPASSTNSSIVNRSGEDFLQDLLHSIPSLDEYIDKVNSEQGLTDQDQTNPVFTSENLASSLQLKRYPTIESILRKKIVYSPGNGNQLRHYIWLYDTESFLKSQLETLDDPKLILDLISSYIKNAIAVYAVENDPVGLSQVYLLCLKAIQILDQIATKRCPLLKQYSPGVSSCKFEKLLLPHRQDLCMLDGIMTYFSKRDRVAYHPCIIDKRDVTSDTFAVRFAADHQPMLQLQQKILFDTELEIEEKMVEVYKVKQKCLELKEEIKLRENCSDCQVGEPCDPCDKLEQRLETKRYSVPVYERPFPLDEQYQLAIVFELMAPPEIVCIREALAILRFDLLGQSYSQNEKFKWIDYKSFQPFKNMAGTTMPSKPVVNLCSQQLATSKTHHTRIKNPDVLTLDPDPNSFVVYNGLDCTYDFKKTFTDLMSLGSDATTFHLHSTVESEHDLYLSFQWALEGTDHTQNKIIAEVSSLTSHPELIAFGSLRGGHRIQLMNLYKYISGRELALEKESVVAIILQTLWEAGPFVKGSRESHLDFENRQFALGFLSMLTDLVEQNDTNYANPLILLNVVLITTRILELAKSAECNKACYELLRKCRKTATSWLTMIDNQIEAASSSSNENVGEESDATDLLVIRAYITIASVLSFDTDGSDEMFLTVIQSGQDVVDWFHTIVLMSQLTQQENADQFLSPFSQKFLNRAKMVPLNLSFERRVTSVKTKEYFSKCLHTFTCSKWERADNCVTSNDPEDEMWNLLESHSNVVFREYFEDTGDNQTHSHLITLDLILGTFLVNGYLQSGLPLNILHNHMFQLYFKGAPIKVQGYQPNCFRTVEKFHGNHYHFEVSPITQDVRIREVHDDCKWDLVDPDKIRDCVWHGFVDGYTHWVDVDKKLVQFRMIPNSDSDYRLPPELTLRKDDKHKNGWRLCDERLNCWMLCRDSVGFSVVHDHLKRLEQKRWVNVLMDKKTGLISAKLPRHHLTFDLINGQLHSVEYDFAVSLCQTSLGTLIGLQQCLLLESGDKQLVLVPHGKLDIEFTSKKPNPHQKVIIPLDELRQPSLFVYEFDPVLKRLKADKSKSAWLYLAALHAATSSSLTDPFTQVTGTEMATQILQSAFIWSCAPYDEECLKTLTMIRKMAPRRTYYGHDLTTKIITNAKNEKQKKEVVLSEQMETIEWPLGLPSMAAFDGYAIIIDKLLDDSHRLEALHSTVVGRSPLYKVRGEKPSDKLQMRGYQLHLNSYNKAVTVKPHLVKTSVETFNETAITENYCVHSQVNLEDSDKYFNLKALLSLAQTRFLGHLQLVDESKRESNLSNYLLTSEPLSASFPPPSLDSMSLRQVLDYRMGKNWLKLYVFATADKTPVEKHFFSVLLSALAYQGRPMEQILNLHNISVLSETINFPKIPSVLVEATFSDPSTCDLDEQQIRAFLLDRASLYCSYILKNGNDFGDVKLKAKQRQLEIERKIDQVVTKIKSLWPCERLSRKTLEEFSAISSFWADDDFLQLNKMITIWFWNFKLKSFIESVEHILNKFYQHMSTPRRQSVFQFDPLNEVEMEVKIPPNGVNGIDPFFDEIDKCVVIDGNLEEAAIIFYSGSGFQNSNVEAELISQREQCMEKIAKYWQMIQTSLAKTASKKVISITNAAPRLTPTSLAQYLLYGLKMKTGNSKLVKLIGALCVLWVELKRFNRCLALKSKGDFMASELERELANEGHDNWSPVENPEWLLLELELGITIRPVQVQVARQMITMPDKKNGVMQLNMGEGKTSVIVPMLCATLANETDSLCRVTVLQSIYKTNLTILSFAVGGLLSRRLYTFPCRRDMPIDEKCLTNIMACYQECLKLKGVVLSLPEHRLSFRLLSYDKTLKAYPELGVKIREVENGLRRYARDILDESDELFNVKYQLVYTIGSQVSVDGGKLRWNICQRLLGIVQQVAGQLLEIGGTTKVEFDAENYTKFPERFSLIRLLDGECRDVFLDIVVTELLKETKLTERQKLNVKRFLTQENINEDNFKSVVSLFKNDTNQLDELRLLYGYLQRHILFLGLSKRWRVDYGVDRKGYRRMAVPFRAKDCPAERTEFGHPDVAIMFTHLSYYYSGLSDSQLEETFDILKRKQEAETIYAGWLQKLTCEKVYKFLVSFSGVNLSDTYQKVKLFEMFRMHKSVIDFWLSNTVFPQECKQFPGKCVMTAWDLCFERCKNPITGFSGTNDSNILLPLPISQQDLAQLQDTNDKMERTLLRPENAYHKGFPMRVTCRQILEQVKEDSITVLIDSGALMLECDNEQVAQLWLEVDKQKEAVVYFNLDNELMVKFRGEHRHQQGQSDNYQLTNQQPTITTDTPFELSPYRDRLQTCGVYLDDQHTRGTDLKLPQGSKAGVTIGSGMRRDKLMQACMRMRKLGFGHSVSFYLSCEAHGKILQLNELSPDDALTTQHVINWVVQNTEEFNKEGLLYWAMAGRNYAQKLAADEFYDGMDNHAMEKINTLAHQCLDDEILLLKDLYGNYSQPELLKHLIPQWFAATEGKLVNVPGCYILPQKISKKFYEICDAVQQRCAKYSPEKLVQSSHRLEEEQEKEVEIEQETETEQERQNVHLPGATANVERLHENVIKAVKSGEFCVEPGIVRLCDIFEKTTFWKLIQPGGWSCDVFCTQDFVSVVKSSRGDDKGDPHFKTDSYLRPIEYLASAKGLSGSIQMLVLSPFEVHSLLPDFRSGKMITQLHMFAARSSPSQNLLVNMPNLQLPRYSPVTIPAGNALSSLLVAGGNLYFGSMEEQKAFAQFLALVPRPWSHEQACAFENEMIKKSGFLAPKYRQAQLENCNVQLDAFQKDPIVMVRKILACRHATVSDLAHVCKLLNQNWYVNVD